MTFLIATLDDIMINFGANDKAITFYKKHIVNLVSIGQIAQDDVDIINRLINFDLVVDSKKWVQEYSKKDFFVMTINRIFIQIQM